MCLYEYANYMPTICQLSQVFSKGYWRKIKMLRIREYRHEDKERLMD